ncbi:MAG: hypothetical protein KDA57_20890 [Planctomycetales bacterium]|nr:hypothetical protein [Planctomycetales bacterium]QKS31659.1 MAG: hypothetical protein HT579_15290 [Candidatus Accumulibacter similis]
MDPRQRTEGAAPCPFNGGELTSHALTHEEIIRAFGETVRRAIEAAFDGIELHGADEFLIQDFFSSFFNPSTSMTTTGAPRKRWPRSYGVISTKAAAWSRWRAIETGKGCSVVNR